MSARLLLCALLLLASSRLIAGEPAKPVPLGDLLKAMQEAAAPYKPAATHAANQQALADLVDAVRKVALPKADIIFEATVRDVQFLSGRRSMIDDAPNARIILRPRTARSN